MPTKPFAVFDIDGTLIRWQLYHAVVDRLAKQGLIDPDIYQTVREARMTWKKREHSQSFKAYEKLVIAAYESALPNLDVQQFNDIVAETAKEYKQQVYSYTRKLVQDLKRKGYLLLAISGSHQELVEHVGRQYGFDHCIGTQYIQKNGRFTGQKIVASDDKKTALGNMITEYGLTLKDSYAVGDSQGDAPMLAMVEHPIAFNPNHELYETAQDNHWTIIIERKNVIYTLVAHDGRYELE